MDQTVLITLIIVVAILLVLWLYRDRLTTFLFKASKDGLEAELKAGNRSEDAIVSAPLSTAPSVVVRGNRQQGNSNVLDIRRDRVDVSENVQEGDKNKLSLGPDKQ